MSWSKYVYDYNHAENNFFYFFKGLPIIQINRNKCPQYKIKNAFISFFTAFKKINF
jgi:hypothetical protein